MECLQGKPSACDLDWVGLILDDPPILPGCSAHSAKLSSAQFMHLVGVPLPHGSPKESLAAVARGGAVVLPRRAVATDGAVLDRAVVGEAASTVVALAFRIS